MDSLHKGPVRWKMPPFDDVIINAIIQVSEEQPWRMPLRTDNTRQTRPVGWQAISGNYIKYFLKKSKILYTSIVGFLGRHCLVGFFFRKCLSFNRIVIVSYTYVYRPQREYRVMISRALICMRSSRVFLTYNFRECKQHGIPFCRVVFVGNLIRFV